MRGRVDTDDPNGLSVHGVWYCAPRYMWCCCTVRHATQGTARSGWRGRSECFGSPRCPLDTLGPLAGNKEPVGPFVARGTYGPFLRHGPPRGRGDGPM